MKCLDARNGFRLPLLAALLLFSVLSTGAATFVITNNDGANEGLNDATPAAPVGGNPGTTIGQQRLNVFQRAAEVWGAELSSVVPIRVNATFDPLPCTAFGAVLGAAGPEGAFRDFNGAPVPNTFYPSALANALAGTDLDPNAADITMFFNSEIGTATCLPSTTWYYGLDSNAPAGTIDLLDVVLHELGHGLGFLTLVNGPTGQKFMGADDAYMRHLENHATGVLYPNMTDAERVAASTSVANLHWVGTNVIAASTVLTAGKGAGNHVEMYAPNPFEQGSSVSHWSTSLTPDELMEPFATSTSIRTLTVALFKDIGWPMTGAPPTTPSLSINDVAVAEGNSGTVPATFLVTLNPSSSQTVTVNFATTNGTATLADGDYTTNSGVLTFPPGTTNQTITVQVNGDIQVEPNETFFVNLSNPINATLGKSQGAGTINNEDTGGTLTITDVSQAEGNAGTNDVVFTVTRTPAGVQSATVLFTTSDGTATVANNDYLPVSGTLTFPAGTNTQTITVQVLGDVIAEPNETFFINLSSATNAVVGRAQAVGTLLNDDAGSGLSIANTLIVEGNSGNTNAVFVVTLSPTNAQTVTVDYATALGTATAGTDFVTTSGTLTFQPGETTNSLVVPVVGDTAIETNENFFVNLTNATNATISNGQGLGTILDDDAGPVDLVVTAETNAVILANAITGSGGDTNLIVRGALLQGHANANGVSSSGVYALLGASPHTYTLTLPGVVLSSGNALDYQTGTNKTTARNTSFGGAATAAQEALLDPITGGNFTHFDVSQLDINFDVSSDAFEVSFFVVFGSEEYPEFVNGSFVDGFGIYLNGVNIAFTGGAPVNIKHPDMAPVIGTELDGILAPGGNPLLKFTAPITPGSTNNTLTFIISDTSDPAVDTTVYVSSLQAKIVIRKPSEAPPPRITAVDPPAAELGATVVLTGENFSPTNSDNIVYFGATQAKVTAATTTSLTVQVPPGATFAPITVTVDGRTGYSIAPFEILFASNGQFDSASFAGKIDFPAGNQTRGVAVADFNNDGRPDLAAANFNSGTVSLFRNLSSIGALSPSSFATKVDVASGFGPYAVAAGDLNGDGRLDLAVANYNNGTVSLYQNLSAGNTIAFGSRADLVTGSNPRAVRIVDVDLDGLPDVVAANEGSSTISVFRNLGTGAVTADSFAGKVDFIVGTSPSSIAVGDIDGNGKPDLVVANAFNGPGGNTLSILRNTSTGGVINAGSFAVRFNVQTRAAPLDVAVGDFDGDGKPDLASANSGNSSVSVYHNNSTPGSLAFDTPTVFASGSTTRTLAIGDVDGDGKPDLAVANESISRVSVLHNISAPGAISFASRVSYATAANAFGMALADLDRDAKPELIVACASGSVSVLRNLFKANPPGITWSPADLAYGTPLSSAQINATAGIPGNFIYNPGTTTTLELGVHTLSATFIPFDTEAYAITSVSANLNVTQAVLTVTVNDASRVYGGTNPVFAGTLTGLQMNDNITAVFVATATPADGVGGYPITPQLIDPDNRLANYTVTTNVGTLTITPAPLAVTPAAASRAYGAANPAFTGVITGLQNNDPITATYASAADGTTPMGVYGPGDANAIKPTLVDPNGRLANYTPTPTLNDGTLTITGLNPPAITLLTPTNSAALKAPGPFTLEAEATDSDGTVAQVVFYAGSTPIGTNTTTPYQVTWTNAAIGVYSVYAVATDNEYTTANSNTNTVTVHPAINTIQINPSTGRVEFNYTGAPNTTYVIEATGDLSDPVTWIPITTNTVTTGSTFFVDPATASAIGQRFYRFREQTPP